MSYAKHFLKMDKIDRLFDAIDHPERYSDAELQSLLQDPEVREVFNLLDKTKASLIPVSTPDVNAEWAAFKLNHRAAASPSLPSRLSTLFSRNIAASIAIVVASFAAVAAIVGVSVSHSFRTDKPAVEPQEKVAPATVAEPDTVIAAELPATEPEIIIFDNEPLSTIIARIADDHGYSVAFNADSPKTLRLYFRWNRSLPIEEVIESLNNFEQLHLTLDGNTIKID